MRGHWWREERYGRVEGGEVRVRARLQWAEEGHSVGEWLFTLTAPLPSFALPFLPTHPPPALPRASDLAIEGPLVEGGEVRVRVRLQWAEEGRSEVEWFFTHTPHSLSTADLQPITAETPNSMALTVPLEAIGSHLAVRLVPVRADGVKGRPVVAVSSAAVTGFRFTLFPALHCPPLHCIALPCTALPSPALHCPSLHCIALHCTALPFPALHCPSLHCIALPCSFYPLSSRPEGEPQVLSADMEGEEEEGGVLVGYYTYQGGAEGDSLLEWYRYADEDGQPGPHGELVEDEDGEQPRMAGGGMSRHVPSASDVGCFLSFRVTPVRSDGAVGTPQAVCTAGPIRAALPSVSDVWVEGDLVEGGRLVPRWTYAGGRQGNTRVQWFSMLPDMSDKRRIHPAGALGGEGGLEQGGGGEEEGEEEEGGLRVGAEEVGRVVMVVCVPVRDDGEEGAAVESSPVGPIMPGKEQCKEGGGDGEKRQEGVRERRGGVGRQQQGEIGLHGVRGDGEEGGAAVESSPVGWDLSWDEQSRGQHGVRDDGEEGAAVESSPVGPVMAGRRQRRERGKEGREGLEVNKWLPALFLLCVHLSATAHRYTLQPTSKVSLLSTFLPPCHPPLPPPPPSQPPQRMCIWQRMAIFSPSLSPAACFLMYPIRPPPCAPLPLCAPSASHVCPIRPPGICPSYACRQQGECRVAWVRVAATGEEQLVGRQGTYTVTAEDVGSRLRVEFTPVRTDGVVGEVAAVTTDTVTPDRRVCISVLEGGVLQAGGEMLECAAAGERGGGEGGLGEGRSGEGGRGEGGAGEGDVWVVWYRQGRDGRMERIEGAEGRTYVPQEADYGCCVVAGQGRDGRMERIEGAEGRTYVPQEADYGCCVVAGCRPWLSDGTWVDEVLSAPAVARGYLMAHGATRCSLLRGPSCCQVSPSLHGSVCVAEWGCADGWGCVVLIPPSPSVMPPHPHHLPPPRPAPNIFHHPTPPPTTTHHPYHPPPFPTITTPHHCTPELSDEEAVSLEVEGRAEVGAVLHALHAVSPALEPFITAVHMQWWQASSGSDSHRPIDGATSARLPVTARHVGAYLLCSATVLDSFGRSFNSVATTATPIAPATSTPIAAPANLALSAPSEAATATPAAETAAGPHGASPGDADRPPASETLLAAPAATSAATAGAAGEAAGTEEARGMQGAQQQGEGEGAVLLEGGRGAAQGRHERGVHEQRGREGGQDGQAGRVGEGHEQVRGGIGGGYAGEGEGRRESRASAEAESAGFRPAATPAHSEHTALRISGGPYHTLGARLGAVPLSSVPPPLPGCDPPSAASSGSAWPQGGSTLWIPTPYHALDPQPIPGATGTTYQADVADAHQCLMLELRPLPAQDVHSQQQEGEAERDGEEVVLRVLSPQVLVDPAVARDVDLIVAAGSTKVETHDVGRSGRREHRVVDASRKRFKVVKLTALAAINRVEVRATYDPPFRVTLTAQVETEPGERERMCVVVSAEREVQLTLPSSPFLFHPLPSLIAPRVETEPNERERMRVVVSADKEVELTLPSSLSHPLPLPSLIAPVCHQVETEPGERGCMRVLVTAGKEVETEPAERERMRVVVETEPNDRERMCVVVSAEKEVQLTLPSTPFLSHLYLHHVCHQVETEPNERERMRVVVSADKEVELTLPSQRARDVMVLCLRAFMQQHRTAKHH
ncbi:unnamed protein product [Closterium sp. NIES-65]|nr:unnamed protein product [Closterium sp. NIES-65]